MRSSTTAADPAAVATAAFFAGVPLLITVRTLQAFAGIAGVNRLFSGGRLVDPESRFVVAPNRDTLYALAVLDLRGGAQVLTLPDIPGRYHVVQLLDAWMGGVGLLGTRSTGGRAGSWAIVPPGHDGPVPDGVERLECPTDQALVLARVRAVDDADAAVAAAAVRAMRLEPLARLTGKTPPPEAPAMPAPPGRPNAMGEDGVGFFDELGDALAVNAPVTDEQRAAIAAAEPLGVGPGRHPGAEADAETRELLAQAVASGRRALAEPGSARGRTVNGWTVNLELGTADTDGGLRERAVIARYFWGPVPAEEAVYPRLAEAADGEPLDGSKRYRIRFPAGGLPPVGAFWSLTVYGADMFLVPNPAGRYSLGGDTPGLVADDDGGLEVYLQREAPAGREANWLPVPDGPFTLIMRLYLPQEPVLDGTYSYPPVEPY